MSAWGGGGGGLSVVGGGEARASIPVVGGGVEIPGGFEMDIPMLRFAC